MAFVKRVARGSFFLSAAAIVSKVGTLATSIVLVRALGSSSLGQLTLLQSWVQVALMFATFGLGTAATRFTAEMQHAGDREAGELIGTLVTLGVLMPAMGAIGLGIALNTNRAAAVGLAPFAMAGVVWMVLQTIDKIGSGVLLGYDRYADLLRINVFVALATLPVWIVCLAVWRLQGAVYATVGLQGVQVAIVMMLCYRTLHEKHIAVRYTNVLSNARRLMSVALPTMLGEVIMNPVHTFALTAIATMPDGMAQIGLLSAALRFASLANFLPSTMAQTLVPALTVEWVSNEGMAFRLSVERAVRFLWLVALPAEVFVCAACQPILRLAFGRAFADAWPIVFLITGQTMLQMINETYNRAFIASKNVWLSMSNNVVLLAIFIPLLYWLIPSHQALGYAIAYLVSFAAHVLYQAWWSTRLYGVERRQFRPWVAWTLVLFGAALGVAQIPGVLALAIGALLAAMTLAIEWRLLLTEPERQSLRHLARVRLTEYAPRFAR